MKQTFYSLLIISLLLISGNLSAQSDSADFAPKKAMPAKVQNPRVSSKPAYQPPAPTPTDSLRDTSSKHLTSKESLNQPISGGVLYAGLVLGITRGQFAENTGDAIGYGFDIGALINLSKKRTRSEWEKRWVNMYAGAHFMFVRNSSTNDDYSTNNGQYTTKVDSKVRNNMYQLGPIARIEFLPGPVKLFIEAGAGFSVFNGVHKVETTSTPNAAHKPEEEKTVTDSHTLSSNLIGYYTYAAGLRICRYSIGLEFKFASLSGGTASYVDTKSVTFDRSTNKVAYSMHKSRTDLFIPTIAISGRF